VTEVTELLRAAHGNGVRDWPGGQCRCDASAAAPYDPDRRAPGVMLPQITAAAGDCSRTRRNASREQSSRIDRAMIGEL
jgi:hypothetical protein